MQILDTSGRIYSWWGLLLSS